MVARFSGATSGSENGGTEAFCRRRGQDRRGNSATCALRSRTGPCDRSVFAQAREAQRQSAWHCRVSFDRELHDPAARGAGRPAGEVLWATLREERLRLLLSTEFSLAGNQRRASECHCRSEKADRSRPLIKSNTAEGHGKDALRCISRRRYLGIAAGSGCVAARLRGAFTGSEGDALSGRLRRTDQGDG